VIFETGTRQIPPAIIEFGGYGSRLCASLGRDDTVCVTTYPIIRRANHLCGFALNSARQTASEQPKSITQKQQFCEPLQTDRDDQDRLAKIFIFPFFGNHDCLSSSRLDERGVSADRHERGGGERWT
jgi:hypothetical protein